MPGILYNKLREVIKTEGLSVPIVVREKDQDKDTYEIVDGQHRWRICKDLALDKVPCIVVSHNDSEAKIKTLQLNYFRGRPDNVLLQALVHDLSFDYGLDDLTALLPFSDDAIRQLNDSVKTIKTELPIDMDKKREEYSNAVGSDIPESIVYNKENIRIYNGDCFDLLRQFENDSIDMVFADPPYFCSNVKTIDPLSILETNHGGSLVSTYSGEWDKSMSIDEKFDFNLRWLQEVCRILKSGGTVFVSGTMHNIYTIGYILEKIGYRILNSIVWKKKSPKPSVSGRILCPSTEIILWAAKSGETYTFNYDYLKNTPWPEDRFKKLGSQMRDVWDIDRARSSEQQEGKHPTQKPFDLLKRIILAASKEGDIILDPFAGSCTTAVAAKVYNRQAIMLEKDKKYCDIGVKRLENLTPELIDVFTRKKAVDKILREQEDGEDEKVQ